MTVNNACNLNCPHCYLQYSVGDSFIRGEVADALCEADFSHLAIVGKEPLVNRNTTRRCQDLILRCVQRGKTVSLITNGHGLRYLDSESLELLAWIDVSLDGGPRTYTSYRAGSYERIRRNLEWIRGHGYRRVNALHTLSGHNITHVDDMMAVEHDFPFERIVFSPYVTTLNHGNNLVSPVSVNDLCRTLAGSVPFMESPKALLLLGIHPFKDVDAVNLGKHLERAGLLCRTVVVENSPLDLGILRVTYDGLVLTPYESLHTANYHTVGRPLIDAGQLNQIYHDLRFAVCA